MLRVKSFDITDDKGMNDLLGKYKMAPQTGILISNGKVCIPYEDGEDLNKDQKIINLKEDRLDMLRKKEVIIHSNDVLEMRISGFKKELEKLEKDNVTPGSKETYDKSKEIKEEIKNLENAIKQDQQTIKQNQFEIDRYDLNIQVFDKKIKELE